MPNVIKRLPDHVANQIAAGEVVQRPASVVKELLENAIDAGATKIQLILKEAGRTLVQVIDNGKGMTETDARLCFDKHATSKIDSIEDLFSIGTKGFRGEAMASIAAVAQVELKTKITGEDLGIHIQIEGSEIKKQEPCNTLEGTNILVKNLFFNIPARRNFLKSNAVETRHIIDEFQRVALTHPEVELEMHHNGNEIYHLKKEGLRSRIVSVFGKAYNERLVPIEEETSIIKLSGFIGKPECARKTRGEQFFFVNNRFIKSHYFNHAVNGAYKDLIPTDLHPSYYIYLEVDPKSIDVNIHPTKTEVKFEDERSIYAILQSAVKQSLGRYNITPTIDFEQETSFQVAPIPRDRVIEAPTIHPNPNYNPFSLSPEQSDFGSRKVEQQEVAALDNMYQQLGNKVAHLTVTSEPVQTNFSEDLGNTDEKLPYQLHGRYIINHIKSGFIVIDQRRAHQRILFEQAIVDLANNQIARQQLLFPITLDFSQQDIALLQSVSEKLNGMGFDLSEFGKGTVIVNGIPASLSEDEISSSIDEILNGLKNEGNADLKLEEKIARSMAKAASVKQGIRLNIEEMKAMIDQLFACEQPYYSPTGKPTIVTISMDELEKKFKG